MSGVLLGVPYSGRAPSTSTPYIWDNQPLNLDWLSRVLELVVPGSVGEQAVLTAWGTAGGLTYQPAAYPPDNPYYQLVHDHTLTEAALVAWWQNAQPEKDPALVAYSAQVFYRVLEPAYRVIAQHQDAPLPVLPSPPTDAPPVTPHVSGLAVTETPVLLPSGAYSGASTILLTWENDGAPVGIFSQQPGASDPVLNATLPVGADAYQFPTPLRAGRWQFAVSADGFVLETVSPSVEWVIGAGLEPPPILPPTNDPPQGCGSLGPPWMEVFNFNRTLCWNPETNEYRLHDGTVFDPENPPPPPDDEPPPPPPPPVVAGTWMIAAGVLGLALVLKDKDRK